MARSEDRSFVVPAAELDLAPLELDPDQVVAGEPRTGIVELADSGGIGVGIWEHSAGTSTDVEEDEVFVVLTGRATITLGDGAKLKVGPGDVGVLRAGERTVWEVHEDLRKVYLTGLRPRREDLRAS